MDLIAWLEDLAAAYRIEPSEMTTRRYLKSLERWRLAPEQWEQLSDRAVLRFARFPSIAELLRHCLRAAAPGPDRSQFRMAYEDAQ